MTVNVDVAESFAGLVSGLPLVTEAVFDIGPAAEGSVNFSEIVAVPPLAMVPSEQTTVAVPVQLP
jgi:hypothetical protein